MFKYYIVAGWISGAKLIYTHGHLTSECAKKFKKNAFFIEKRTFFTADDMFFLLIKRLHSVNLVRKIFPQLLRRKHL
jgi:hypothetical protein